MIKIGMLYYGIMLPVEQNHNLTDWGSYISVVKKLDKHIKIDKPPLLIIHPGFSKRLSDADMNISVGVDPGTPIIFMTGHIMDWYKRFTKEYNDCIENIKNKIDQSLNEKRTIILFVETDYLMETLTTVGLFKKIPDNFIIVPTINGGVEINSELLGENGEDFYQKLAKIIKRAEICGDGKGCIEEIDEIIGNEVKITKIKNCTFPDITYPK